MEHEISKSQKKRDALELKKIGMELIELPLPRLEGLPLSAELLQALITAKGIKSHGARRRQVQFIGKLLLKSDSDAIIDSYSELKSTDEGKTASFHEVERWRLQLIEGGNSTLSQFVSSHPEVDVQQLRHLIKKAVAEKEKGTALGASKALFRFLRSYVI